MPINEYTNNLHQIAIRAESEKGPAIQGINHDSYHAAVFGGNDYSGSDGGGPGIYGKSTRNTGVIGVSDQWVGVYGFSNGLNTTAILGKNDNRGGEGVTGDSLNGTGILGQSVNGYAGRFKGKILVQGNSVMDGDVTIKGFLTVDKDIRLTPADCAEDFTVINMEQIEPGTVMILSSEETICPSDKEYDKRVAGVISGAGNYKPAIILDNQPHLVNRVPIALMGKVFCKVDATYGAIEIGDLLTTSPTTGHAMKAIDLYKSFGAVIGKALRPLAEGVGLIPILISLQ